MASKSKPKRPDMLPRQPEIPSWRRSRSLVLAFPGPRQPGAEPERLPRSTPTYPHHRPTGL
eukprot:8612956-Pyramimonas_sp.AAC.1